MSLPPLLPRIFIKGPHPEPVKCADNTNGSAQLADEIINSLSDQYRTIGNKSSRLGGPRVTKEIVDSLCVRSLDNFLQKNPNFNLQTPNYCDWTCMALAIREESLPLIHAILDRDPSIANKAWGGLFPYTYIGMAAYKKIEIVQTLLESSANVNSVSADGSTPLYCSAQSSYLEARKITKFLLLRGAVLYGGVRNDFQNNQGREQGLKGIQAAQHGNILHAINEIKKAYDSAYKYLPYLAVKNTETIFAWIPNVLAAHVMSFLPETQIRYQFLVKNGLIHVPVAENGLIPKATTAASSALSLNETDPNIDGIIASNLEGLEEEKSKESASVGSSSRSFSSVVTSARNALD